MSARIQLLSKQSGMMLLEGLIAILLFSLGILAIVGMQATTVKEVGDAKYRSDAAMLANQLIGTMWVSANRTNATNLAAVPATLYANFDNTAGAVPPALSAWVTEVTNTLPGITANTQPSVAVTALGLPTDGTVTITLKWISPSEAAAGAQPHRYTTVAQIQ